MKITKDINDISKIGEDIVWKLSGNQNPDNWKSLFKLSNSKLKKAITAERFKYEIDKLKKAIKIEKMPPWQKNLIRVNKIFKNEKDYSIKFGVCQVWEIAYELWTKIKSKQDNLDLKSFFENIKGRLEQNNFNIITDNDGYKIIVWNEYGEEKNIAEHLIENSSLFPKKIENEIKVFFKDKTKKSSHRILILLYNYYQSKREKINKLLGIDKDADKMIFWYMSDFAKRAGKLNKHHLVCKECGLCKECGYCGGNKINLNTNEYSKEMLFHKTYTTISVLILFEKLEKKNIK